MTDPTTQPIKIDGYHAHVYYDAETRPRAERLREEIAATLDVEVRELSDEPRGPHPVPQFRFTFSTAQFENIVPWLMLNRQGLDVLVHPLTDNSYDDHSRYAVWLGAPVALKLNTMRRTYRAEQYPTPPFCRVRRDLRHRSRNRQGPSRSRRAMPADVRQCQARDGGRRRLARRHRQDDDVDHRPLAARDHEPALGHDVSRPALAACAPYADIARLYRADADPMRPAGRAERVLKS